MAVSDIAEGMLNRYSTGRVALEMATDHGMDYPGGSEGRVHWAAVYAEIARLLKEDAARAPQDRRWRKA